MSKERSTRRGFPPEAVRQLRRVASKNSVVDPADSKIGAVHATSLETMDHVFKNGTFPGYSGVERPARLVYKPGDLSVYPTPAVQSGVERIKALEEGVGRLILTPTEIKEAAIEYASDIARRHSLLTSLSLPFSDRENHARATQIFGVVDGIESETRMDPAVAHFQAKGKSREQIDEAIAAASSRKGFLVGFSSEIQSSRKVSFEPGEPGSSDIRIRPKEGTRVSAHLVVALEPLGDAEKDFVRDRLQRKNQ
ncbi:MAG TPA: hypothetical protein VE090_03490 [Methylomirabilota bacterium]|nr:hypothetical protein [Methylomirabilota bacterium]